jgi:predicted transcriptional regulator
MMINQLPDELAQELEVLAATEQRPSEEILREMFAHYRRIKPKGQAQLGEASSNLTRDEARARLLAAGSLVTQFEVPEDAVRLSVEERMKLGTLKPSSPSTLNLINEDRGEW